MTEITKKAYAKINLHLDITGIMQSGFHAVNNIMQSITLCDTVTLIQKSGGECHVSCNIAGVPTGEKNIAYRALRAFCEHTGEEIFADIHIEKHIPMAAGLAGGSADAAAALLCANELCGNILSKEELCVLGGRLGADVPFCIVGGCMYATGKGDILNAFPKMPDCTLVIACGGEGVSTPEAYRMLDGIYNSFSDYTPMSVDALRVSAEQGDIYGAAGAMFNIFEAPILSVRPVAKRLRQLMEDGGAIRAMMSGSGPSVFGIFDSAEKAELACEKIREIGVTPHICKPISL